MFTHLNKYSCIVLEVFTLVQILLYYGSGTVYSDMIIVVLVDKSLKT